MNCKNCGAELSENSVFCGNCGMKVAENNTQETQGEYRQTYNEYQEQGSYQPPVTPEYTAEPIYSGEKPNTVLWIVLAAVEIFTCCQITGIISLIYAILGHVAADKGDFFDAQKKVKTAKTWFWVGLGIGIFVIIVYFMLMIFGFAAGISDAIMYY